MARPKKNKSGQVFDSKTGKYRVGRPTVFTPDVIQKLETAFSFGCSDREACAFADIGMATLYEYQKANAHFAERKEQLKEKPILAARATVVKAINNGDVDTSKWMLERKLKKEFSARSELTGENGEPLFEVVSDEHAVKIAESIAKSLKSENE